MAAPSTSQPLFAALVVAPQLHRGRTFPPRRGRSAGGAPPAHPPARPPRAARRAQLRSALRRGSHPGPRPARWGAAHAAAPQPRGVPSSVGLTLCRERSKLLRQRHQRHARRTASVGRGAPRRRWQTRGRCTFPPRRAARARLRLARSRSAHLRRPTARAALPTKVRSAGRRATALPPLRPCAAGLRPAARPRHTGPQSGRTSAPRPPAPGARLPPGSRRPPNLLAVPWFIRRPDQTT